MSITWFLEKSIFNENLQPLKDATKKYGHILKEIEYVPFNGRDDYNNYFDCDEVVLFYGSLNLAKQLQNDKKFNPYIFCNRKNMNCMKYYAYYGDYVLNKDYIMLPYSELKRQKEWLYNKFNNSDLFIRPCTGFKVFTGQTVNYYDFDKEYESMGFYDTTPEEMVLVSSAKKVMKEWRFVVVKGKIITGSMYKDDMKSVRLVDDNIPDLAYELANDILKIAWKPDPAFTLDICQDDKGEFHLLEINSFSCSGLYDCDMNIIVKEVSKLVEEIHIGEYEYHESD